MSKDKYPRNFFSQMEGIVLIILQIFIANGNAKIGAHYQFLAVAYSVTWHVQTNLVWMKIFYGLFKFNSLLNNCYKVNTTSYQTSSCALRALTNSSALLPKKRRLGNSKLPTWKNGKINNSQGDTNYISYHNEGNFQCNY